MRPDELAEVEESLVRLLASERAKAGDERSAVLRAMSAEARAAFSEAVRAGDRSRAEQVWAAAAASVGDGKER